MDYLGIGRRAEAPHFRDREALGGAGGSAGAARGAKSRLYRLSGRLKGGGSSCSEMLFLESRIALILSLNHSDAIVGIKFIYFINCRGPQTWPKISLL